MVEFRGWWIVLDTVSWIFIAIVFGMAVGGAWPPSPWDVIFLVGLLLACVWALLAWKSVRTRRRPPDAGAS
jgi:Kef-type K+ transport system membrane component KefB